MINCYYFYLNFCDNKNITYSKFREMVIEEFTDKIPIVENNKN
jgi:hypothetical protein